MRRFPSDGCGHTFGVTGRTRRRSDMNGQRAVGLIAGAVLAAMLVTTAAVAASEPLTPQAIRAMGERYQAMAEHYGTSSSLPPQAIRAMGERYEAMAEHFGGRPTRERRLVCPRRHSRRSGLAGWRRPSTTGKRSSNRRSRPPARSTGSTPRSERSPRPGPWPSSVSALWAWACARTGRQTRPSHRDGHREGGATPPSLTLPL